MDAYRNLLTPTIARPNGVGVKKGKAIHPVIGSNTYTKQTCWLTGHSARNIGITA